MANTPPDDFDYAIIGKRMAESAKLGVGDNLLVRWRDKNGTFDAREIQIASIFRCDVPAVDRGQIYLRLDVLQKMMGMGNEATLLVAGNGFVGIRNGNSKIRVFCLQTWTKLSEQKPAVQLWKVC
jgi:hypothetical protein